jgi:hypothetical protein
LQTQWLRCRSAPPACCGDEFDTDELAPARVGNVEPAAAGDGVMSDVTGEGREGLADTRVREVLNEIVDPCSTPVFRQTWTTWV